MYIQVLQTTPVSDAFGITDIFFPIDASGLYTIAYSMPESAVVIMKRNTNAYFERIVTLNVTSPVVTTSTNGKWFVFTDRDSTAHVFQVNANQVVQKTALDGVSKWAKLLSDDSLVFVNETAIATYQFVSDTWTLSGTTQIIVSFNPPHLYHLTDTTFAGIYLDRSTVYLYRRKEDKSWALKESFTFENISEPAISVVWNGNDTVLLGSSATEPNGAVWLYTKQNNGWTATLTSDGSEIGIRPAGTLGFAILLLDPNTILVSAPLDGFSEMNAQPFDAGSVNVLARDTDGEWKWHVRVESEPKVMFGFGMALADQDILVLGCTRGNSSETPCRYHSLPTCFRQASQVTCKQIDSCQAGDFDISSLYSVNDPQCGDTSAAVSKVSVDASSVKLNLVIDRIGAPSSSCDAIVACSDNIASGASSASDISLFAAAFILALFFLY